MIDEKYIRIGSGMKELVKDRLYADYVPCCFIDLENGNILSPMSSYLPHKNAIVGNIKDKNPFNKLGPTGVQGLCAGSTWDGPPKAKRHLSR
jgi:hypothetical protein